MLIWDNVNTHIDTLMRRNTNMSSSGVDIGRKIFSERHDRRRDAGCTAAGLDSTRAQTHLPGTFHQAQGTAEAEGWSFGRKNLQQFATFMQRLDLCVCPCADPPPHL
ncbi:hypothetical protein ETD86_00345 [Nonomuraea turkmeniaca]|uniref:Uncharacterized protein n=1 Tax=Nonomuraea turkmeniaca TaxID=103838 RepID=A0A5S4FXW1_9ACTN|nr:hypothetical protein ETD86_00345 [Nonomuraea turkmeniaca]